MFFVYFSLFQDTWRDRQSFGTLLFEVLGTVIREKQRSNKLQLEKSVVILVVSLSCHQNREMSEAKNFRYYRISIN